MRSRTLREGSVGLLILLGLGLFGVMILWLRGVSVGKRSYKIVVQFANVAKMQSGASVRYRGVTVGKTTAIKPGSNGVDVEIAITPAELIMPRDILIEANQGGLIGETSIDITPLKQLPADATAANPLDPNCRNSALIVCDRDRFNGVIGVNFDELVRGSIKFTNLFADPAFFANINSLVKNSTVAAAQIAELTREVTTLTQSMQKELGTLSASAVQSSNSLTKAADQITVTAGQFGSTANQINSTVAQFGSTANQFASAAEQINATATEFRGTASEVGPAINQINATAREFGNTANQIGSAASQINATARQVGDTASQYGAIANQLNSTAGQVNSLVTNVNNLVATNGETLNSTLKNLNETSAQLSALLATNQALIVTTLNNLTETSEQIRTAVSSLTPVINEVEQGQLLLNLQALSANAAIASANLRDLSNPTNLVLLQQTLDSARATFQNAEKITSDLDDLTGDPNFRTNVRNLLNNLNNLLSSTEQLEQQTLVAQRLTTLTEAINSPVLQTPGIDNQSTTFRFASPDASLTPLNQGFDPASPQAEPRSDPSPQAVSSP